MPVTSLTQLYVLLHRSFEFLFIVYFTQILHKVGMPVNADMYFAQIDGFSALDKVGDNPRSGRCAFVKVVQVKLRISVKTAKAMRRPLVARRVTSSTSSQSVDNFSIGAYFGHRRIFTIDGRNFGNVARYFSHSCAPNLFCQTTFVDIHDYRCAKFVLFILFI